MRTFVCIYTSIDVSLGCSHPLGVIVARRRLHFLSMHKDDIERAGIPDRRVFFDFCPQQCRKEEKRKRKEGKRRWKKTLEERQFYYAYILTPQHQHYARDRLATIHFIAMTMMKKRRKRTKKVMRNIKCDRSSQDDDIRVPSGTRFETSGNPRFEKDKTSEMETSPPSPQTQRVKKRPLEALPLCACPISITASTLMDLSRSLTPPTLRTRRAAVFYSSLVEKCEKTTKTELVSTKKPRTKTVRKDEGRNISICTVVPQKKYSVCTSSIPHVGNWDCSPRELLRRAKAVERMLCDLLQ